ncbi:MAG: sigma-70 family RNA polymerase sigma factor [Bryobacteraceae bacterium]
MLDRNALFHANMEWAAVIARKFARKLPPKFDVQDIEQEARIECWKRVQVFDPGRGATFQGYAYIYVLGACRMAVRRRHWAEAMMPGIDQSTEDPRARGEEAISLERDRIARDRTIEQQRDAVAAAAMELPEPEGRLVAAVLEGASISDLEAIWVDRNEPVKRRLSAATRKLKKKLRPSTMQPICNTAINPSTQSQLYSGKRQILNLLRKHFGVSTVVDAQCSI